MTLGLGEKMANLVLKKTDFYTLRKSSFKVMGEKKTTSTEVVCVCWRDFKV